MLKGIKGYPYAFVFFYGKVASDLLPSRPLAQQGEMRDPPET